MLLVPLTVSYDELGYSTAAIHITYVLDQGMHCIFIITIIFVMLSL